MPLLQDGTVVVIKGTIPQNIPSFWLSFIAPNTDHVFHCHMHYDQDLAMGADSPSGILVRDVWEKATGEWQVREFDGPKWEVPKGSRIEIRIVCNANNYEYYVNGKFYFKFKSRMIKERATSIYFVNFEPDSIDYEMPQYNSAIRLPPVVEGMEIIGKAVIKPGAKRVIIHLITQDDENIALHVHYHYDMTNQVCRASVTSAKHYDFANSEEWGSSFQAPRRTMAKFNFLICKDYITGMVNGRHAFDYKHRIPIEKIKVAYFLNEDNADVEQTSWRVLMPGETDVEQTLDFGRVEIIAV